MLFICLRYMWSPAIICVVIVISLLFCCCCYCCFVAVFVGGFEILSSFFSEKKLTWPMSQVFSLLGHGCMMQSMQMLLWNFNSIQSYLGQKTKWLLVAFV